MFRINRNQLPRLCQGHQQIATDNQGFFVSKCQALAGNQGSMTGLKAGSAHNRNEDTIDIIARGKIAHGSGTEPARAGIRQLAESRVVLMALVCNSNRTNGELTSEGNELIGAGMNGKRYDVEKIGMLTTNVQGLGTNGTSASQNGNTKLLTRAIHHKTPPTISNSWAVMQPKISESDRSSIPP